MKDFDIALTTKLLLFCPVKDRDYFEKNQSIKKIKALWGAVGKSKRQIDRIYAALEENFSSDPFSAFKVRYALAQFLLEDPEYNEEAANEYAKLWQHSLKYCPSFFNERITHIANDMAELVQKSTYAKKLFSGLQIGEPSADASRELIIDWVTLNDIVGATGLTLNWFDQIKNHPSAIQILMPVMEEVLHLLAECGRWRDIGNLFDEPVGYVARKLSDQKAVADSIVNHLPSVVEDGGQDHQLASLQRCCAHDLAPLYIGLLSVSREYLAQQVLIKIHSRLDRKYVEREFANAAYRAADNPETFKKWRNKILLQDPEAIVLPS